MKGGSLKERFERFMSVLPETEDIDALTRGCNLPGRRKADYLAFDRRVIIEQKSFDVDVDNKIQVLLRDLTRVRGPVASEEISLASIAQHLAQSADLPAWAWRLRQILTQRVDDILAKADKQTRDTRETFVLPEAIGMVVILNEHAQLIEPDFVVDKAFEMLRKESRPGELRYPENQAVLLISEAHRISTNEKVELIPTETILSNAGNIRPIVSRFAEVFLRSWAEFNGAFFQESAELARDVRTRDAPKLFRADISGSR